MLSLFLNLLANIKAANNIRISGTTKANMLNVVTTLDVRSEAVAPPLIPATIAMNPTRPFDKAPRDFVQQ